MGAELLDTSVAKKKRGYSHLMMKDSQQTKINQDEVEGRSIKMGWAGYPQARDPREELFISPKREHTRKKNDLSRKRALDN